MPEATTRLRRRPALVLIVGALVWAVPVVVLPPGSIAGAQGRGAGGRGAAPAAAPRDAAPVDLTGYWVSLVTEDWVERMSPDSPPSGTGARRGRGGAAAPPLPPSNPDDPCRVYGAAGSMRVPGRLHITWAGANTLQIDMDSGRQTRVFHFDPTEPPPTGRTLQGYSVARWDTGAAGRGGRGRRGRGAPPTPPAWGSLKVVTTNMTGGYLLSSRANYSADADLREEFIQHSDFGVDYLTVTAIIEDGPSTRFTSSTFKREPDGSKFSPAGCQ